VRAHHERNLRFGEPDCDCLGHQGVFALTFACHGCGASPPAIGTVERFSVAAGRGAACAPPVSTVESRRVAAGRGSTYASSIGPVEPGLLSGSCLVDRQVHESEDQNREQHTCSLSPVHFGHASPPDRYALVLSRCAVCVTLVAWRQTFVCWRQSLGGKWPEH